MADVIHLKDKGIPLKIDGATRFVKGATKYTTCSDVIKMVLKKTGISKEYRHLFTIYEVTSDVEMALSGKCRILKVVEAWRGQPNRLVLRKTDPLTPLALNDSTKKWNLKKRSHTHLPALRKIRQPNMQTVSSQTESADKVYQNRLPESISDAFMSCSKETMISDTTTDSDTSMDEFLSNLDQSKLAGLINFFAAVAKHKARKEAKKRCHEYQYRESAANNHPQHGKSKRMKKRVSRSKINGHENRRQLKESSDCHPKKMHAVTRVNFGFIDVEPRPHDSVYSISDIYPTEGQQPRLRANSARIFSARRRLIPSTRSSVSVVHKESDRSSGRGSSFSDSSTSEDENFFTRPYQEKITSFNELWSESYLSSSDSGHEGDSDTSANLDKLLVSKEELKCLYRIQELSPVPTPIKPVVKPLAMSSNQRLVDYSITDDEVDCSDDDMKHAGFFPIHKDEHVNLTQHKDCFSVKAGLECEHPYLEDDKLENSISYLAKDTKGDCEANRNVADYIKSIFGNKCANEDEEMNSFMKSMVLDDSSDEGLSSIESDTEKERDNL